MRNLRLRFRYARRHSGEGLKSQSRYGSSVSSPACPRRIARLPAADDVVESNVRPMTSAMTSSLLLLSVNVAVPTCGRPTRLGPLASVAARRPRGRVPLAIKRWDAPPDQRDSVLPDAEPGGEAPVNRYGTRICKRCAGLSDDDVSRRGVPCTDVSPR